MEENRQSQRHVKRLRAVILQDVNGAPTKIHGKTLDISTTGVSIICDYSLKSKQLLTVCLLIHAGDQTRPPVIFEAKCKIVVCVLAPQQGGFRIGFEFVQIEGDGAKVLKKFLSGSVAMAG